ncbi:MAG: ATP-binding protein [bacterium]
MTIYKRRLRDYLVKALSDTPVVALLGARQCGKTTLSLTFVPEYEYFTFDDIATLTFARSDPIGFVASLPSKVILDEIQRVPELLMVIKRAVDKNRSPGRFLITGSANLLLLPTLSESLAGRMEILELEPLSACELAGSDGNFLHALINGDLKPVLKETSIEPIVDIVNRTAIGGFPEAIAREPERARAWHRSYLRAIFERDIKDVANVRDPALVGHMLALLAQRTGQLLNVSSLCKAMGLRRETIEHYLAVCERLYLVRRVPAWHRNPSRRIIKSAKIHIADSGLATSIIGLNTSQWMKHLEQFGHILESYVVQQIYAQAGWTSPHLQIWHYRDKDQNEVDIVITNGRDTWGLEVKASSSVTAEDGKGLRSLARECGADYRGGVILYNGSSIFPLNAGCSLAVPLSCLWNM